jgi:choice-of-anchor B domain-containing protein
MTSTRRLSLSFIGLALLATVARAHDGDPKLIDKRPMYPGRGWKNAERMGGDGNLLLTGPALRFQKSNVTLLSWLSLPDLNVPAGGNGNSCFGYTSPSGREYAIIGVSNGTAFVEVTQPGSAVLVAKITGPSSLWRDVRTYSTYAYAVSEGGGGIQIMNLANIDNGVVSLVGSVNDDATSSTHTIAINQQSGYLYRSGGGSNGLRIYNLNPNPAVPVRVGTWSARYSHEVSVFSYTSGPAAGKEIAYVCGGLNGGFSSTGIYVVDVTNKAAPLQLQYISYANAQFCHQCWPSPDMHWLYIDDELDDQNLGVTCVTRVFDISNPLAVVNGGTTFTNNNTSIDHNQYTKGNFIFQSNYRSGLHVQSTSNPGTPTAPVEVAFFDTWPEDNNAQFNGLWNNYPYFASGTVVGSDIEKGLFVWWVGAPQVTITPVSGDPDTVSAGGQPVSVQIGGSLAAGTAKLHVDTGSGFTAIDLADQGGGVYSANLPATACGTILRYYYSAQSTNGIVWSEPEDAPEVFHQAVSASSLTAVVSDDFETSTGWVVGGAGDTATSGIWARVDPNGTSSQPADDHTPAGTICYVTAQSGDVDNGRTTLTSPAYDLTGLHEPVVRYWRWYSNSWTAGEIDSSVHAGADVFRVEVSNNNGGSWTNVETVGPATIETIGGWIFHQFTVSDYVAPTSQVKIRFIAEDAGTDSNVEAAVDDFAVVDAVCQDAQAFCFGDGSNTDCPCFNLGATGHGCENSSLTGGAILGWTGTASLAADSLVLTSTDERPTALSVFVQGDVEIAPTNFGDGLRCMGGSLKRLYSKSASGGSVTAPAGAEPSISARSAALGSPISAFQSRFYQVYYRDPASSFCPPNTFNVSSGVKVVWGP